MAARARRSSSAPWGRSCTASRLWDADEIVWHKTCKDAKGILYYIYYIIYIISYIYMCVFINIYVYMYNWFLMLFLLKLPPLAMRSVPLVAWFWHEHSWCSCGSLQKSPWKSVPSTGWSSCSNWRGWIPQVKFCDIPMENLHLPIKSGWINLENNWVPHHLEMIPRIQCPWFQ